MFDFKSKQEFVAAIKGFFSQAVPEIAQKLVSRLTENFQSLSSVL